MKIAQILHSRLHYIFEADEIPDWPPDQDGNSIVLIDVTGKDCKEGDGYNHVTGATVPYPEPETIEGYYAVITWNEDTYEFAVEYVEIPPPEETELTADEKILAMLEGFYGNA